MNPLCGQLIQVLGARVGDRQLGHTSPVGGNGIGLKNIEERLRILFGDRDLLQITSPPDGGACVTLRMPHSIL